MPNEEPSNDEESLPEITVHLINALMDYAVKYGLTDQARDALQKSENLLARVDLPRSSSWSFSKD